jgi:hypothetical protein
VQPDPSGPAVAKDHEDVVVGITAEVADDEVVEVGDAPAVAEDAGAVDDDVERIRGQAGDRAAA